MIKVFICHEIRERASRAVLDVMRTVPGCREVGKIHEANVILVATLENLGSYYRNDKLFGLVLAEQGEQINPEYPLPENVFIIQEISLQESKSGENSVQDFLDWIRDQKAK